jgi:hypothetical protein
MGGESVGVSDLLSHLVEGGLLLCSLSLRQFQQVCREGACPWRSPAGDPSRSGACTSWAQALPSAGIWADRQELLQETNFDDESVSSYSDRWVPGSGMPGSFCLVVGPFGPLAPVVSVEGGPRAAAVFATVFLLILESSSSADFGRRSKRPAGFRMAASAYSNIPSGRWLLSFPPVAGRWLCQSPASLPHIHQVEGIYQVSFPCQGRYSPVTLPVRLEDDGDGGGVDDSKTVSSGRCSSGSGAVRVFCLAPGGLLGVFWTPFGEGVFLRGALGLPWPPLGAWAPLSPVGGHGRSPCFPFPGLIPFST